MSRGSFGSDRRQRQLAIDREQTLVAIRLDTVHNLILEPGKANGSEIKGIRWNGGQSNTVNRHRNWG
jgi:hypothetical protein